MTRIALSTAFCKTHAITCAHILSQISRDHDRHAPLIRARKPRFRRASSASRWAKVADRLSALARSAASSAAIASARASAFSARDSARSWADSAAAMTARALAGPPAGPPAGLSSRGSYRGSALPSGTYTRTWPSLPGWRRHLCRLTSLAAVALLVPRATASSASVIQRPPAGPSERVSIAIVCRTASSRSKRRSRRSPAGQGRTLP